MLFCTFAESRDLRGTGKPSGVVMATFAYPDMLVMLLYLAAMLGVGLRFAGRQKTTETYFLAGRAMPWTPVALSLYASLTSATTYLVLPSKAYHQNIAIIVAGGASLLVAPFLIHLFYPVYRRLRVTTSYEYLGLRFGSAARWAASLLFVMARLSWMGLVVYAPSLALAVITTWPLWVCILLMGLLATVYTALGGISAVLWTDVVQFVILVGGAVWVAILLSSRTPGGPPGILSHAAASGHLAVFGLWPRLAATTWLSAGLYFFLQMMQDYGTDQVSVQHLHGPVQRTGTGVVSAGDADPARPFRRLAGRSRHGRSSVLAAAAAPGLVVAVSAVVRALLRAGVAVEPGRSHTRQTTGRIRCSARNAESKSLRVQSSAPVAVRRSPSATAGLPSQPTMPGRCLSCGPGSWDGSPPFPCFPFNCS